MLPTLGPQVFLAETGSNRPVALVDTAHEAIKNEADLKSHFATSNAKSAGVADLPSRGVGEADGAGPEILAKHSGSPAGGGWGRLRPRRACRPHRPGVACGACAAEGVEAKSGSGEDSFCRVRRPIARLWVKKPVKNGPPQLLCSRRPFCRAGSSQQVHPGLRQLGPRLDLRQQRAREHQRLADPVGYFDDAQAVGVTVGDEDAKGKRCRVHAVRLLFFIDQ